MNQRLYRSRDDRIIFGVAGGLAQQFNIDPSLIRILWVILALLTAGAAVVLYIAMAFIVPEEPAGDSRWAGWQASYDGYQWPDESAATAPPTTTASASAVAPGPAAAASGATPSAAFVDPTPATAPTPSPTTAPLGTEAILGASPAWSPRQERRAARAQRREAGVDGRGALFVGLILMLVGGYFLVRAYVPAVDVDRAWPILIVVVGVVFLLGSVRRSAGPSA